jgi:DNA mismatch repair protein MutS
MEKSFGRIRNFNVAIKEVGKNIIFLRKLVPGGSNHSFGIHVAQMAGMPRSVVARAEEILAQMEKSNRKEYPAEPVGDLAQNREGFQLSFFQLDDPVLKQIRDEIRNLDINRMSPLEALNKLNEIKKIIGI